MTKEIWKFILKITDEQMVLMPKGAEILSVQLQDGTVCIWALCNPDASKEQRSFYIYGTGNTIQNYPVGKFIGTVQMGSRFLAWHIFEKTL